MLRVGQMLYGYCEGVFGREGYGDKRVEAIGADWVVARGDDDELHFYAGCPEDLLKYTTKED